MLFKEKVHHSLIALALLMALLDPFQDQGKIKGWFTMDTNVYIL